MDMLEWFQDFVVLSETGHFSRAAEYRNITQPAFSRRVRALENWVGAPLFSRDTHRAELTIAGEQFKPIVEEILLLAHVGRELARNAAKTSAQTIHFASTHALSIHFFPDWLRRIEERTSYRAIVNLMADNMAGCEQKVLRGEAQFLLCQHHPSATNALNPRRFLWLDIGEDRLVPVSKPANAGNPQPLYALPGSIERPATHLAYSKGSGMGRIIAAARAIDAPTAWLSTIFTSHVVAVLVAMARSGRGLAWVPLSLVDHCLASGELVRAGDKQWDIPITTRIFRSRMRQSPAVEQFWKMLLSVYQDRAVRSRSFDRL